MPSAVVITSPFKTLARATAINLGVPDVMVGVVDHPIWTRDAAWLERAAAEVCEPLIARLFPSA